MLDNFREVKRHWCAKSEHFTGCDSLLHTLQNGWQAHQIATVHYHTLGSRTVKTYTITLSKQSTLSTMRIIDTPMLRHVMSQHHITVVKAGEHLSNVKRGAANLTKVASV